MSLLPKHTAARLSHPYLHRLDDRLDILRGLVDEFAQFVAREKAGQLDEHFTENDRRYTELELRCDIDLTCRGLRQDLDNLRELHAGTHKALRELRRREAREEMTRE